MARRKNSFLFLMTVILVVASMTAQAQTASFNFTQYPVSVSGWVNIAGNPAAAVCSATDPSTGFTVSSIAAANWSPYTNGLSAYDSGGISGGTFFPAAVMLSHWFQYNNPATADYNGAIPQLKISGLQKDSVYTLRMTGSYGSYFDMDPTQYTVLGARPYGYIDINANNNTSTGAVFSHVSPDTTGSIYVYVNTVSTTQVADICGIQIITGSSGTYPAVSITNPLNNAGLSEDGTVTLTATASESGGSIARVEFYVDTTLLGTVTSPPYSVTWSGADPGPYTIIANAVDAGGNSNASAISVNVQSLNYYWSTTGNIGNDGDSNFVGNVDSVRLGFRTKNIERMTISPTGNVGIGTISPTAQLHVTGSVRLAGLTNDSTSADPRILVSDTLGNLAYRNFSSGGAITVGPGLGETSTGAVALGDTVSGTGPHSFTSNRYEYLNGYQYSIGGSVNDPVNHPNFLWYDNGDWTAGTTMNRSVNTLGQTGMRYYQKLGVLQIGASDWLDTTESRIVNGSGSGSGILINSDTANTIKGRLANSVFAGSNNVFDSTGEIYSSLIAAGGSTFGTASSIGTSVVTGYGNTINNTIYGSVISGMGNTVAQPMSATVLNGANNVINTSTSYSFVSGYGNQFGGNGQFVSGANLVNRVPMSVTLGNADVDFSSIPFGATLTGTDPLFVIGNSSTADSSIRSNAITVLYNGRTQINTTGFSSALTQANVTPKAALEVVSTNTGVLLPKLTTAQQSAIGSADLQNGLLLYNTDSNVYQFYNGSAWLDVGSGLANGGWGFTGNSGTNPTINFVGTTDSQRLVFRTADTERMTILPNGAVGIGISSQPYPDALLAVNGTIYTTKVKVTQLGWPDYVFDKHYMLPSLASVQRYIRLHGHLPGIAPAATIAGRRLDLGDNEAVLLKKIEELTLYLLQQNDKAEAQQQEIDQLTKENQRIDQLQARIGELKQLLKQYSAAK